MTDYASCLLQLAFLFKTSYILAFPPKSEFFKSERKFKSDWFQQFIHVNLGIAGKVCQNLPFICKNAKNRRKTQNSFAPYLTSACLGRRLFKTANSSAPLLMSLLTTPPPGMASLLKTCWTLQPNGRSQIALTNRNDTHRRGELCSPAFCCQF